MRIESKYALKLKILKLKMKTLWSLVASKSLVSKDLSIKGLERILKTTCQMR